MHRLLENTGTAGSQVHHYVSSHMMPDPKAPVPTTSQVGTTVPSFTTCAATCSSKPDCLGYSYKAGSCNMYHDVIYYEDLSSDQGHHLIHYEVSKITHPVCTEYWFTFFFRSINKTYFSSLSVPRDCSPYQLWGKSNYRFRAMVLMTEDQGITSH